MTAFQVPREKALANFKSEKKSRQVPVVRRREKAAPGHRKLIQQLPCCVCGKPGPSDGHHLKHDEAGRPRGSVTKSPDAWLVPLCSGPDGHHTGPGGIELAGSKNELEWFRTMGIENAGQLAADLFAVTGDLRMMQKILFSHMHGGF